MDEKACSQSIVSVGNMPCMLLIHLSFRPRGQLNLRVHKLRPFLGDELFYLSRRRRAYRECDSEMYGRACRRGTCHIYTLPFVIWTWRYIVH